MSLLICLHSSIPASILSFSGPSPHYETYIRDHSEQILAVLRIQFHGLIIIGSQQNFRTGPFPQLELLFVQGFLEKLSTLLEDQLVDGRKIG